MVVVQGVIEAVVLALEDRGPAAGAGRGRAHRPLPCGGEGEGVQCEGVEGDPEGGGRSAGEALLPQGVVGGGAQGARGQLEVGGGEVGLLEAGQGAQVRRLGGGGAGGAQLVVLWQGAGVESGVEVELCWMLLNLSCPYSRCRGSWRRR